MKLSLSKIYNENKDFIKNRYLLCFGIGLVCYMINSITDFSFKMDSLTSIMNFNFMKHQINNYLLTSLLISTFINGPFLAYCAKFYTKEPIEVKFNFEFYYKAVIVMTIHSFLLIIGMFLFIVPGFYISYKLQFLPYIFLENYDKLGPIEILKKAYHYDQYPISQLFFLDLWFLIPCTLLIKFEFICLFIYPIQKLIFAMLYISPTVKEDEFNCV